jgi:hypothetical protein
VNKAFRVTKGLKDPRDPRDLSVQWDRKVRQAQKGLREFKVLKER